MSEIEVTDLAALRRRGRPREFTDPQRLAFDLLIRVDRGQTQHAVDFTSCSLGAGDVLWVRTGQVQQWGDIASIDGPVVLFVAHALDQRTRDLVRSRTQWAAVAEPGTPIAGLFDALAAVEIRHAGMDGTLRAELSARLLSVIALELALSQPPGSAAEAPGNGGDEVYSWLLAQIEEHFSATHTVADYAARLGYSTRTLNRVAQKNAGVTVKQLIDQRVVLEAKRLLAHADDAVWQVGERVGFTDPANFAKFFAHRAGLTPSEFRDQVRGRLSSEQLTPEQL